MPLEEAQDADRCWAAMVAYVAAVRDQARLEGLIGAGKVYSQSVALIGVVWVGTRDARSGNILHHRGSQIGREGDTPRLADVGGDRRGHQGGKAFEGNRVTTDPAAPAAADARRWGWVAAPPPLPDASLDAPALEFRFVSFAFGSVKPALDSILFSVWWGEQLVLVGPSGGGKSTIWKPSRQATVNSVCRKCNSHWGCRVAEALCQPE
jgi:ABC-type multidrug transport system fused ATPase/permease subunit